MEETVETFASQVIKRLQGNSLGNTSMPHQEINISTVMLLPQCLPSKPCARYLISHLRGPLSPSVLLYPFTGPLFCPCVDPFWLLWPLFRFGAPLCRFGAHLYRFRAHLCWFGAHCPLGALFALNMHIPGQWLMTWLKTCQNATLKPNLLSRNLNPLKWHVLIKV